MIAFFFFLGRKNEHNYNRRIEEMREEERRQSFEAAALKLEKEAANQANKAKKVIFSRRCPTKSVRRSMPSWAWMR